MEAQRKAQLKYQRCLPVLVLFLALSGITVHVAKCDPIINKPSSQPENFKDLAQLNLKTPEGKMIQEDAEYDEGKQVVTLHGSDGSFYLHDFEKGLRLMRDTDTGICYVAPVGTNKATGVKLEKFIKDYDGQEIQTNEYIEYKAIILPGAIRDTSFLPEEAEQECNEYRWLTILEKESGMDECQLGEQADSGDVFTISDLTLPLDPIRSSRHKRQIQGTVDLKWNPQDNKVVITVGVKFTIGRKAKKNKRN